MTTRGHHGLLLPGSGVAPAGTVSFVAASGTTYAVATSQDQTIPAGAAVGDLLLAFVMHRDTLTPPAGWTLVRTEGVNNTYIHSLSVYRRTCQSGDPGASTTWAQATSTRIAVHIVAFSGSTGTPTVDANNGTTRTTTAYDNTTTTATINGQIGIVSMSWVGANTIAQTMTDYTQTTTGPGTDSRLGVAYRTRNASQSTGGTWIANASGTNGQYHAQVSLMLKAP